MTLPKRPILAIDLDNTLTKFTPTLIKWYNDKYETNISPDEPRPKEIFSNNAVMEDFYKSIDFLRLKGYERQAIPILKRLHKYFELVVITCRPRSVERRTREWLDYNFPYIFDRIYFAYEDESGDDNISDEGMDHNNNVSIDNKKVANSFMMNEADKKQEICDDFHIQFLVDDEIENVTTIRNGFFIDLNNWKTTTKMETGNIMKAMDFSELEKNIMIKVTELGIEEKSGINLPSRLINTIDNLVKVSTRKTVFFYLRLLKNKLRGMSHVKILGTDDSIVNALTIVDTLVKQKIITISKVTTAYHFILPIRKRWTQRQREMNELNENRRVPKLEIEVKRTHDYEIFIEEEKEKQ